MKKVAAVFLLAAILCALAVLLVFSTPQPRPSTLALNDALAQAAGTENQMEAAKLLAGAVDRAMADVQAARVQRDNVLKIAMCLFVFVFAAAGFAFYAYCWRSILQPFEKMRAFAQNVAAGNLDVPLEMDRGARFGAFTESFDLMREELKRARENERAANRSKKELVASLSHDIKTPVASIKAVAELMQAKGEGDSEKLGVIMAKADQIDLLVSNMFHATLEELEELKVVPVEAPSTVLPRLVKKADYENRVSPFTIPECIVTVDEMRLQQVFDNIISNAYKYGGEAIRLDAWFEGEFLALAVRDSGAGVAENDAPLIFEKFYRGAGAQGKSGSGLGLYISRHFVRKMGGDVVYMQGGEGFGIKILLKL